MRAFAAFLGAAATGGSLLLLAPPATAVLPNLPVRISQLVVYAISGAVGRAVGGRIWIVALGAAGGLAITAHEQHYFTHIGESLSMEIAHGLQAIGVHAFALLLVAVLAAWLAHLQRWQLASDGHMRWIVCGVITTCAWYWPWYWMLTSPLPPFLGELEGWWVDVVFTTEIVVIAGAGGMLTRLAGIDAAQTAFAVLVALAWGGCEAASRVWDAVDPPSFGLMIGCVEQGLDLGLMPWLFLGVAMVGWDLAPIISRHTPRLTAARNRRI